jgi:hypothetical protein
MARWTVELGEESAAIVGGWVKVRRDERRKDRKTCFHPIEIEI